MKHCRYFFNKNAAGSLPLLYLLACLLGAATIHVGIADCSFPAMVEESGSANTASRKSVHRHVCKYTFYGCRDLCYICISKGDGELEVVVISNRCFSYCVGSRSEKGEQHHSICLCLKYLSAFFHSRSVLLHLHQSTPSLAVSRLSGFRDSFLPPF